MLLLGFLGVMLLVRSPTLFAKPQNREFINDDLKCYFERLECLITC